MKGNSEEWKGGKGEGGLGENLAERQQRTRSRRGESQLISQTSGYTGGRV